METKNESTIELDMTDWDRSILYYLICESSRRNISTNQVIVEILENAIREINNNV